jgi:hypothetical protein
MDDVRYIATHPLLQRIMKRCAELVEEASALAEGTREKRELEKRISLLEQYRLPKPTEADLWRVRPIRNEEGKIILPGARSARERWKDKRRGRPDQHRVAVRAALEAKILDPRLTWRELAKKYGLERWDLERQIYLLKATLKREGIRIPSRTECLDAEESFERGYAGFARARRRDDVFCDYLQGVLTPEMAGPTGPGYSCQ